jgi:hypothetical protein
MKHYTDLNGYVRCQQCKLVHTECTCDECSDCVKLQAKLDKALKELKAQREVLASEYPVQDPRHPTTCGLDALITEIETVESGI